MRRRLAWSTAPATFAVVAIGLAAGASPTLAAGACTNAAIRAEQSAGGLPGCRGYEKVSPQDKGGFSVTRPDGSNFVTGNIANATVVVGGGDGIGYVAGGATADPDSQSGAGISYRGSRGPDGWATTAISPPLGPPAMPVIGLTANPMISSDGTRSIVQTPAQLAPGAPACASLLCAGTIYLQDNATRTRKTIGWAPLGEAPALGNPEVAAATPSLDRVVFTDADVLVPGAIDGATNLYEWIDDGSERGRLRLVGLDDEGEPFADGAAAGQGPSTSTNETRRALSADGRRIFFTSGGQLYARLDGTSTVHLSASQRSSADPEGPQPATFWTAEAEHGSAVYFTSGEQLTDDSRASVEDPDLYRYDVDARRLTDVTANAGPADVLGVIGASEDARSVYFGATAQLLPGEGEAGAWNVYRWTDDGSASGRLSLVAVLHEPEAADAEDNWLRDLTRILPVQVSPSGRYLALLSSTPLTDQPTAGTIQVYRYDAETETVTCASCRPEGADPTAAASFREIRPDAFRVVSDRGQVAFQTYDPLVAEDTNGQRDVYLYDDEGARLISSGKSPELSTFMGMSASGDDVFFATRQPLVADDADRLIDLYDARVGGGFAAKATPVPCEGDACQGRPSPPAGLPSSGSSSFVGAGNLPEPPVKPKPNAKLTARATAGAGTRFSIRVTAPSAGTITLTGTRITTVKRKVGKAGRYTLRVSLRTSAKRTLARTHRLKVRTKVAFAPKSGKSSSKTVALTVKGKK